MRGINLRFSNANALSSLTAQAGACSSSAYAATSKIIALQAIWTKGFSPWNQWVGGEDR